MGFSVVVVAIVVAEGVCGIGDGGWCWVVSLLVYVLPAGSGVFLFGFFLGLARISSSCCDSLKCCVESGLVASKHDVAKLRLKVRHELSNVPGEGPIVTSSSPTSWRFTRNLNVYLTSREKTV